MPGILSVITPAATSALTSLSTAKGDLGVTTTADDAYITTLIARASSMIVDHCGRCFGWQYVQEIFRFSAASYFGPLSQTVAPYGTPLLSQFKPVSFYYPGVHALTINENNDAALTEGVDYDLDGTAGLAWRLRGDLRSWWGVPTVTALYSTGWQLPTDTTIAGASALPGTVEEACISLVRSAYFRRGRDPSVILDITEGVGRIGYSKIETASGLAIDDAMADALYPYRLTVF